jgi:hypothetical protein
VSGNPLTGDTTTMVGLGSPGANASAGYTKHVGSVPPTGAVTLCVQSSLPDGLDQDDPGFYGGNQ